MLYLRLTRFLLPLALTVTIQGLGQQVLNGGMARVPQATQVLAAFGLAWGLVSFLASPLMQTRQLGLVLAENRPAYRQVQLFVLIFGLLLSAVVAGLALTGPGAWVIEELHGVDPQLAYLARVALLWFVPVPVLDGVCLFYSGLLIRIHRTDVVSYATVISIVASIVAVFALLPLAAVQARPILLPILVTYSGLLVGLGITLWGYRRYARPLQDKINAGLSFGYVVQFFWPLALIMAVQGLSRPLINLFVSRGPDGAQALAVLTIVYALGHLPYGWLNEIRNIPPAFKDKADSLSQLRRFVFGCGLLSFGTMIILFWTPLRSYILEQLLGLDPYLAALCAAPLVIFSFFPPAVMVRAYLHGIGLLEHRTRALAPSGPLRIGAILAALTILPLLGVYGATLGVAALLSGFVIEALVVWWGVRGQKLLQQRRRQQAGDAPHRA